MAEVVFVHGAWVGPRCWDGWKQMYGAEGLSCLAPAWPFDDRPYDALRRAPSQSGACSTAARKAASNSRR